MIPSDLVLQTATQIAEKSKKKTQMPPLPRGLASPTTQQQLKPTPQLNNTPLQAVSTALGTAKTINSTPVTPKMPEKLPESGAKSFDYRQSLKDLRVSMDNKTITSIYDFKKKFPEFSHLDDKLIKDLWATVANSSNIESIIQKFPEINQSPSSPIWDNIKSGLQVAWGILWAIPWATAVWKIAEKVGKWLYWLTLPPTSKEAEALQSYFAGTSKIKPKTAIDTAIEAPLFQVSKNVSKEVLWEWKIAKQFWMFWTKTHIWTQAETKASNIWKESIQPILNKAKNTGTTINVQWVIKELGDDIVNLAKGDPDKLSEYSAAFDELQKSFWWKEFTSMTLDKVQTLKSWLQGRTPQKFFKWQEITNAYGELKWILWSKLVWKLHSAIKKDFGVKSADLYRDYANLSNLSEIWTKARTNAWLKWWFGGFVSTTVEWLATPVTTTTWKILYKTWKALQVPGKTLLKGVKNVVKWWNLFTALSDWSLIPWSPSNITNKILNTPKSDRIYIKWQKDMWIWKDQLKFNKDLWKKVVSTDLGYIDENGNVLN